MCVNSFRIIQTQYTSFLLIGRVGLENVIDTLHANFKDTFVGHIRNLFEARQRVMG